MSGPLYVLETWFGTDYDVETLKVDLLDSLKNVTKLGKPNSKTVNIGFHKGHCQLDLYKEELWIFKEYFRSVQIEDLWIVFVE